MEADISIDRVAEVAGRLERELAKAIVGQQRVIREILIAFLAGGHCLLRGVPGLAKTLLTRSSPRRSISGSIASSSPPT